jgi:hypothetical protein
MKIKIISNNPADGQDGITHLLGKEFDAVHYKEFDKDTRDEMKQLGEIAIRTPEGQYIINKNEYEVINA